MITVLYHPQPDMLAEVLGKLPKSGSVRKESLLDATGIELEGFGHYLIISTDDKEKIRKNRPIILNDSDFNATISLFPDNSSSKAITTSDGYRFTWITCGTEIDFLLLEGNKPSLSAVVSALECWDKFKDRTSPGLYEANIPSQPKPAPPAPTAPTGHSADPPKGQLLPSLLASLLIGDRFKPVYANSEPIHFSNEFFDGYAVCMVNSSLPMKEPFLSKWRDDKNTFEVQVQGKFKQKVPGVLFVGAEITKKMELGLLTKSLCGSILNFCRRYNSLLHHSFGDKDNMELPHIVSPFWNTVDRLVITPAGQTPPPLIQRFPEPEELRKLRKKDHSYSVEIDLDSTYSFSLKTMYMDLERWALVNIPLMSTMGLQTFWSDADLRFIAYSMEGMPKYHAIKDQKRLFALEIQHRSNHVADWGGESSAQFYADAFSAEADSTTTVMGSTSMDQEERDMELGSDSEDEFYDAADGETANALPNPPTATMEVSAMPPPSTGLVRPRWRVDAAIELEDVGKRKRRTFYAFFDGNQLVALKSFRECKSCMQLAKSIEKSCFFARCTETEQRRLILDCSLQSIMSHGQALSKAKLQSFLSSPPSVDSLFLQPAGVKNLGTLLDTPCCIQLGNGLWSQGFLSVVGPEVVFARSRAGGQPKLRVQLRSLLSVHVVDHRDSPLPIEHIYVLVMATFSRQYVFAVRGYDTQSMWVTSLSETITRSSVTDNLDANSVSSGSGMRVVGEFSGRKMKFIADTNPVELLSHPKTWNAGDRKILNYRNFTKLCSPFQFHGSSHRFLSLISQPCKLSEELLALAFQLIRVAGNTPESFDLNFEIPEDAETLWLEFLDGVSLLQCLEPSVLDLSGDAAVAMFLNIYHTLLIHAALIVGSPTSLFTFQSFFRNYCYEAFGEVFSLAELEHCVLRKGMRSPSVNLIAQMLIPNTQYAFGLKVQDIRLLWAINPMSMSTLNCIPIYSEEQLHEQLEEVMRASLREQMQIVGTNTIILPQVCQWYFKDIERSVGPDASGSKAVVSALLPYLTGDVRDAARVVTKGSFTIKYSTFDFTCRLPVQMGGEQWRSFV